MSVHPPLVYTSPFLGWKDVVCKPQVSIGSHNGYDVMENAKFSCGPY